MTAAWWDEAPDLLKSAFQHPQGRTRRFHYRFGLGSFALDSDDDPLNRRFSELYPEGESAEAGGVDGPSIRCCVRSLESPAVAAIRFEDPEALDALEFCRVLFPDRSYVPGPGTREGWQTIAQARSPDRPLIAMNGSSAIADRAQMWQPLVANLAVNRLLRLQREVLFFHAASASVGGRGLMFVGAKGAGKTTTALTLAARGHGFLGDEIAAVRTSDRTLLPFRRAASIREGVKAVTLRQRLESGRFPAERFPDGSARVLASVAHLFPGSSAEPATLDGVFFLRRFDDRPRIEPFEFGREHFQMLTPLGSSMWGMPAGVRMLQLSRIMREVRCHHLDPGPPDDTAELLERHCKELRH